MRSSDQNKPIARARFDDRLKGYLFLYTTLILISTVVGIPVVPFWLILGPIWARRYYNSLECLLTERALIVKKGVVFRTVKTIPLDKIQDFSLKEGPLLRKLGLTTLNIETAGQSAQQGASGAALVGVVDVFGFRDRVLAQRDVLASAPLERVAIPALDSTTTQLLTDIRDSLQRIEHHLAGR